MVASGKSGGDEDKAHFKVMDCEWSWEGMLLGAAVLMDICCAGEAPQEQTQERYPRM